MKTFDQIATEIGCDKKGDTHDYMAKYEKHLGHLRNESFNLLEIGVAGGWSMRAWKEIFPKANIYGIDIDPACKQQEGDRINIHIGSQIDGAFIHSVMDSIGEVTVIIDDGSHVMEHEIFTFENLFPRLKNGGYYVLEDLHTCYGEGGNTPLPRKILNPNVIDYFKDKVYNLDLNGYIEGFGNKKRDYDFVRSRTNFSVSYFDEYIDGISFYKSIIFIEKGNGFGTNSGAKV